MSTPVDRIWEPGEVAWFEYHCLESHDSSDADIWYHSHQQVTVLSIDRSMDPDGEFSGFAERAEAGHQFMYRVRFADGLERDVFEDELGVDNTEWCRPDPPRDPSEVRSS